MYQHDDTKIIHACHLPSRGRRTPVTSNQASGTYGLGTSAARGRREKLDQRYHLARAQATLTARSEYDQATPRRCSVQANQSYRPEGPGLGSRPGSERWASLRKHLETAPQSTA
jgi:hypothetical protein